MSSGLTRVYEHVDQIGRCLEEHTRKRFLLGERLHPDGMKKILEIMRGVESGYERELVWHMILQGFDRRILHTAGWWKRQAYRQQTRKYAKEVARPEDASIYSFPMRRKPPASIQQVMASDDPIGTCVQRAYHDLGNEEDSGDGRGLAQVGGQDEVIVTDDGGYVMMMDGWIWKVDWDGGSSTPFDRPPRMAAGAATNPGEPNRVFFCATRWSERTPPTRDLGGIYEFDAGKHGTVEPVVLRVPWREGKEWGAGAWKPPAGDPKVVKVYTDTEMSANEVSYADLDVIEGSRPICYCNDLAFSKDSRYLYFTEPSPYTSMGLESRVEVVKLTRNGRLWRIDLRDEKVGLAAEGLSFVDGVVAMEEGVLVTELCRFRMLLLDFGAGRVRKTLDELPGMPDGACLHEERLWQALLHERTLLITLVHRFTLLKRLYMLLPKSLMKPPKGCGVLVLDKELEPSYCAMHDGSRVHHIATIAASERAVFLPAFHERNRGLHWIEDPTQARARAP